MKRTIVRNLLIALSIISIIVCILFWKWPRPLLSHFRVSEPNAGSILLIRGREDVVQLDFDEEEPLYPLWGAIEHTRVRHLGGYSEIFLKESLYQIQLTERKDGRVLGSLYFSCDDQGNVYIGQTKYEIVGSQELVYVLKQYFDVST